MVKYVLENQMKLWAEGYAVNDPQTAIYKAYKTLDNTIYHEHDHDGLMEKH